MELAAAGVVLLYFAGVVALLFWPVWALVLAYRAVRNLHNISVALQQIHAAMLAQQATTLPTESHVSNSMFGR
jgi:uncharacterized membrane protein